MDQSGAGGIIILIMALIAYFLPAIFAAARGHQSSGGILMLNIFLGWTLLGWVMALVWAFSAVAPTGQATSSRPGWGERACPHCAETIKKAAAVCKHCGRDVMPA